MVFWGISIKLGMSGNISLIRNVPIDVRTRQFRTMAKRFGKSSVEEFGLLVENSTSEERTQLLGVFYRDRRKLLTELGLDHEDEAL
jgi:hypothetical protein